MFFDIFVGTYVSTGYPVAIKLMDFSLAGKNKQKMIDDLEKEFDIMTKIRSQYVLVMYGVVIEPRICMVSFLTEFLNLFFRFWNFVRKGRCTRFYKKRKLN